MEVNNCGIDIIWGPVALVLGFAWIYHNLKKSSWFQRRISAYKINNSHKVEIRREKRIAKNFKRAKILAVKKSIARNKRYYVVEGANGKFTVFNTLEFQVLKKKGVFRSNVNIRDLLEVSSFITK